MRSILIILAFIVATISAALLEDECGLAVLNKPLTCLGNLVVGPNPTMTKFKCNLLLSRVENGVNIYYGFARFTPDREHFALDGSPPIDEEPADDSRFGIRTVFQFGTETLGFDDETLGEGVITTMSKPILRPKYTIPPEYVNKEFTLRLSATPNFSVDGLRYTDIVMYKKGPYHVISK